MKNVFLVLSTAFLFTGISSCKKSGGGGSPAPVTKSVLIKITVAPGIVPNQGSFTGAVNALLPNSGFATWKVNGTVRANENTIAFTQTDLQSGVITLETTANVTSVNLDVSGVTVPQNPFNVTVLPTINGVSQTAVSIPVTSTMTRDFTY